MVGFKNGDSEFWQVRYSIAAIVIATSALTAVGQTVPNNAAETCSALSATVEQALNDTNRACVAEIDAIERNWRKIFRDARSQDRLKRFVRMTLDLFEKLRQLRDISQDSDATTKRIGDLFRELILDEVTICRLLDKSLNDYCRLLDEQEQSLLIKLKIDREVQRSSFSRSVIDPIAFKGPIKAAVSSTVTAVQNDIVRTVASFVASEAISAGVKRAARELGVMPGKKGSAADRFSGLLIEIGVDIAVDAAADPASKMVSDIEKRLIAAEHAILDGTGPSPGIVSTLRRLTKERAESQRRLIEAELSH